MLNFIKDIFNSENEKQKIDVEKMEIEKSMNEKREKAIQWLGPKWILHPENHTKKYSKRKMSSSKRKIKVC